MLLARHANPQADRNGRQRRKRLRGLPSPSTGFRRKPVHRSQGMYLPSRHNCTFA
jgi:hypothetical protein